MRRTLPPDFPHAFARTGGRLSSHCGAARAALPAPEARRGARLPRRRHADRPLGPGYDRGGRIHAAVRRVRRRAPAFPRGSRAAAQPPLGAAPTRVRSRRHAGAGDRRGALRPKSRVRPLLAGRAGRGLRAGDVLHRPGPRFARGAQVFFSSRRRHTIFQGDWSSDVCSSDLQLYDGATPVGPVQPPTPNTTVTVTGLTAGTAYTFTVKAQNGGGDSSESVHSAAFTPTKVTEIGKGSCRERG